MSVETQLAASVMREEDFQALLARISKAQEAGVNTRIEQKAQEIANQKLTAMLGEERTQIIPIGVIELASTYKIENPFGDELVDVQIELFFEGAWCPQVGSVFYSSSSGKTYGTTLLQANDNKEELIVKTGTIAVGHAFISTVSTSLSSVQARLVVSRKEFTYG